MSEKMCLTIVYINKNIIYIVTSTNVRGCYMIQAANSKQLIEYKLNKMKMVDVQSVIDTTIDVTLTRKICC